MNRLMARYSTPQQQELPGQFFFVNQVIPYCCLRAGPAPEEDAEDDGTDDDMVGSKSDDEDEQEAHTKASSAAHPSRAVQRVNAAAAPDLTGHQQRHMPAVTGRDSHGRERDCGLEGSSTGGVHAKGDPPAAHSKRTQKPLSQLQRIAAKVKEQKVIIFLELCYLELVSGFAKMPLKCFQAHARLGPSM